MRGVSALRVTIASRKASKNHQLASLSTDGIRKQGFDTTTGTISPPNPRHGARCPAQFRNPVRRVDIAQYYRTKIVSKGDAAQCFCRQRALPLSGMFISRSTTIEQTVLPATLRAGELWRSRQRPTYLVKRIAASGRFRMIQLRIAVVGVGSCR